MELFSIRIQRTFQLVSTAICLFDFFSGGVFIYKNMEVTVYIFIALFLLGIVRKRDTPSFMLLREILCS